MDAKILVVDDEDTLRHFLKLELEMQGFSVWDAATGEAALDLLKTQSFDAALLDLNLPGAGGLEVMRFAVDRSPQTVIIIITAFGSLDSAIEALKHGAHDYILKPFDTDTLIASVEEGLTRRQQRTQIPESGSLTAGPLSLDFNSRQVQINEMPLKLTPTEFDLLTCLMRQPNAAIDSVALLKELRGYEASEAEANSIVRVYIHRLRQKLETDPANPTLIATVPGGRYQLTID